MDFEVRIFISSTRQTVFNWMIGAVDQNGGLYERKIDVTLPADARATLFMKSDQGEIYSDFDMKVETASVKQEANTKGKKGKFRVSLDKGMRGAINGGGPEYQFTNFNGDIYIRKGK